MISSLASSLQPRVDDVLAEHSGKHVGIAVGVVLRGETATFARGSTGRDRPGLRADTIFEIGSITKVFTATLLASMVEEGELALDDPVNRFLPAGVQLPVRGRPVTLLDLATHTSGLPRLPKGSLRLSLLRHRANPYAPFTLAHLERAVCRARLRREPGKKVRYSNFGAGLLGHVLALRAGATYQELVRTRICEALGLVDTGLEVAAVDLERFADGHNRRGKPVPHWDLPTLAGAGGLRSTVADLLRFLQLQLQEGPSTLERAARVTHEVRFRRLAFEQCLGWMALPVRGRRVLWHNGGTGGFRGYVGFVEEDRTGVVVLSNSARSVDTIGLRVLEAACEPA
jgi:serine-type D-Ala-D-Ala carboxypeptidase/endopeptidase